MGCVSGGIANGRTGAGVCSMQQLQHRVSREGNVVLQLPTTVHTLSMGDLGTCWRWDGQCEHDEVGAYSRIRGGPLFVRTIKTDLDRRQKTFQPLWVRKTYAAVGKGLK